MMEIRESLKFRVLGPAVLAAGSILLTSCAVLSDDEDVVSVECSAGVVGSEPVQVENNDTLAKMILADTKLTDPRIGKEDPHLLAVIEVVSIRNGIEDPDKIFPGELIDIPVWCAWDETP